MPRIRTIKPEFWVDEKVVELDPWARLLFIGLWNFADDQGFVEYSPKRIKMQIFPGDTTDVAPLLASLLECGLLAAYDSPIGRVLHVQSWSRHQKVSNPAAPRFDPTELVSLHPSDDPPPESSRAVQSPLVGKERKGGEEERKGKETQSSPPAPPATPSTRPPIVRFDELWNVYPLHDGQTEARKAWANAIKRDSPDAIIAGAVRYRDWPKRNPEYTKKLANWLRDDCWKDPMIAAVPPPRQAARASPAEQLQERGGLMLGARNIANAERAERMAAIQQQRDLAAQTAIEGGKP